MDWVGVVERNGDALRRIVVMLVAMAGFPRELFAVGPPSAQPQDVVLTDRLSLPRHLRNTILRLLRPTESAVRRLIVVAARGIVVTLPPRVEKPRRKSVFVTGGIGTGIILPKGMSQREFLRLVKVEALRRRGICASEPDAGMSTSAARPMTLPLIDPLRDPTRLRRTYTPAHAAPRVWSLGSPLPTRPPPPTPHDMLDATRLARRLQAIAAALADLPKQARRLARWQARRKAGLVRRSSPLKPGHPPGLTRRHARRPAHEVHAVLKELHYFAWEALKPPDTS